MELSNQVAAKKGRLRRRALAISFAALLVLAASLLYLVTRTPDVVELKFLSLTTLNQRPHVILEIPPNISDSTLQKFNSRLVALYSSNRSRIFGLSNGTAWTENYFESRGPSDSGPKQIDGHRWYFLVPPTTNSWKIQINYNAGIRFKNQYPVYLKRAIWVSPNLPGLAVPPTPEKKP